MIAEYAAAKLGCTCNPITIKVLPSNGLMTMFHCVHYDEIRMQILLNLGRSC